MGAAVLVCSFMTGCSQPPDPAVLPDTNLCKLIPAAEIAPMLRPGVYHYNTPPQGRRRDYAINDFHYYVTRDTLDGGCYVATDDGPGGSLFVTAESKSSGASPVDEECQDLTPTVTPPRLGRIEKSGGCTGQDTMGDYTEAWVFYQVRTVEDTYPDFPWTLIEVTLHSHEGRDGFADATHILQIILDAMDRVQAGDEGGILEAPTPTTPPTPTPT